MRRVKTADAGRSPRIITRVPLEALTTRFQTDGEFCALRLVCDGKVSNATVEPVERGQYTMGSNLGSVNTVDYKDAIVCIKSGHYEPAANYMVKEALGAGIASLAAQRARLTSRAVQKLKATHLRIRALRKDSFSSDEIAEEAYVETIRQLSLDTSATRL